MPKERLTEGMEQALRRRRQQQVGLGHARVQHHPVLIQEEQGVRPIRLAIACDVRRDLEQPPQPLDIRLRWDRRARHQTCYLAGVSARRTSQLEHLEYHPHMSNERRARLVLQQVLQLTAASPVPSPRAAACGVSQAAASAGCYSARKRANQEVARVTTRNPPDAPGPITVRRMLAEDWQNARCVRL